MEDYDLSNPKDYAKVEALLKSIGPKLNEAFWDSGYRVRDVEALAKRDPRFKKSLEGFPKKQGGYAALIKKPRDSARGRPMVPLTNEERKLLDKITKVHKKTKGKYVTWRDYLGFLESFAGVEKLIRGSEHKRGMPVTRRKSIAVSPGASPYEQGHAAQNRSFLSGKTIVKNVHEYLAGGGKFDDYERDEPPEDVAAAWGFPRDEIPVHPDDEKKDIRRTPYPHPEKFNKRQKASTGSKRKGRGR